MTTILIANNAAALSAANPTVTVEAEFGDTVVEGSTQTLAHHGSRSGNPCPCLCLNAWEEDPDAVIGVSHMDLDTLGGVMAVMGIKPHAPEFWETAAEVDVKGVHKLLEITRDEVILEALCAFWAFSESHRVFPPRDGTVADVTSEFTEFFEALAQILAGDAELLEAGRQWAVNVAELDCSSWVGSADGVLLRSSKYFVNHLYNPSEEIIVAFNTTHKTVTLSSANPSTAGFSCGEVVQALWGPQAGGRAGIAGSPRRKEMTMTDARKLWHHVRHLLKE
jgi:hypothetical protein